MQSPAASADAAGVYFIVYFLGTSADPPFASEACK